MVSVTKGALGGILVGLLLPTAVPAAEPLQRPWLSVDGRTLTLTEEIREPPERRQPTIRLNTSSTSGQRQIIVSGQDISPPPAILIACDERSRVVNATALEDLGRLVVATYEVAPDLAHATLAAAACELELAGVPLGIPLDLLRIAWSLPPPVASAVTPLEGTVISVIDGDTIRVRLGDRVEDVRYLGIDAPEFQDATKGTERGARDALDMNRFLVADKTVRLELDQEERDAEGRLLAYVWVGDRMVNAELVRRGYAAAVAMSPNTRHGQLFARLQREAAERKRGFWADDPVSPPAPPSKTGPAPAGSPPPSAESAAGDESPAPAGSDLARRPGVAPLDAWTCPLTSQIKGSFTAPELCVYHLPDSVLYRKVRPDRCYATEVDALRDGCRGSRR
jgi:micrococcal nuclease